MSKYTTEVRFICETEAGLDESKGYNSVADIISSARTKVFNFSYPIFDESYRPVLETKILKHFYTREIAEETIGLWKLRLDTRMNEIMPYYNKMYESELLEYNPLYSHDIKTDHKGTGSSIGTGTSHTEDDRNIDRHTSGDMGTTKANGDSWVLYSDTPQGGIGGIEGAEDDPTLGNNAFLTNATHTIDHSEPTTSANYHNEETGGVTSDGNTSHNVNTTDDYINIVTGYAGVSPNRLLSEYRKNLLNIDMNIINDLEDLFFQLW